MRLCGSSWRAERARSEMYSRYMVASFRRIAIYVNETEQGGYQWILIEQLPKSPDWTEIQAAEEPIGSYHEAMAAGLLVLQAMIDDLEQGPRAAVDADPAAKRPGSHFGFGDLPARVTRSAAIRAGARSTV